jgi:hypothetical protein
MALHNSPLNRVECALQRESDAEELTIDAEAGEAVAIGGSDQFDLKLVPSNRDQ